MGSTEAPSPVVAVPWPLDSDGVARLCGQVDRLLRAGAAAVACDVGSVEAPDLAVVDALARLQLTARRAGGRVQVHGAGDRLRRLLMLTGLADVLPYDDPA